MNLPLPQVVFDKVMLEKYGSYDELYNGIHHYEANEVTNSGGTVLIPQGTRIPKTGEKMVTLSKSITRR